MAWAPSSSQTVLGCCINVTLTLFMHNTLMVFCHARVIQTNQHHISLLAPLKTLRGTVDLFQAQNGYVGCMTSLLKHMAHKLTRKLPCVLGRYVLLIIVIKSQSRL